MKNSLRSLAIVLFTISASLGIAQDGANDPSFNQTDVGFGHGDGGWNIHASLQQADGKILAVGNFTSYDSVACGRLVRLLPDNGPDPAFDPGAGADDDINGLAVRSDGKIIVAGDFLHFDDVVRNRIARLNSDGSLDTTFDAGPGATAPVRAVAVQNDGKIVVVGEFYGFGGTGPTRVARMNTDGSLDTTFNANGFGANGGAVRSVLILPDDKIFDSGDFSVYNGIGRSGVARLNSDGSLDLGLDPNSGTFGSQIHCMVVQPDGNIIIAGNFYDYNNVPRHNIARIFPNGALDMSFDPGTGPDHYVYGVALENDGRIIIAGRFTGYNGVPRLYAARLQTDGSLDPTFDPGLGAPVINTTVIIQDDDKILVGGYFGSYGQSRSRMVRLNNDGSLDPGFYLCTGASSDVQGIALQTDGKIVAIGSFIYYNNSVRRGVARLMPDGTLDESFDTGSGPNDVVRACAVQSDGKVLIVGWFTEYNGAPVGRIARLNADGSLDAGFNTGSGFDFRVRTVVIQPDGKILIGGEFTSYNGTPRARIARLNTDGTLDASFAPGAGPNSDVIAMALRPDGKIMIGGIFTDYNGPIGRGIARLNADGSLHPTFNSGTGVDGFNYIWTIAVQPDEKIVIAGSFESFNGVPKEGIARLNSDGSLDAGFSTALSNWGWCSKVLPNGKILIGGIFYEVNGIPRRNIARLNADGTLDTDFDPGSGANDDVLAMTVQTDGNLMIAGGFTSYDGAGRNRIARIISELTTEVPSADYTSTAIFWSTDMTSLTILDPIEGPVDLTIIDASGRSVRNERTAVVNGLIEITCLGGMAAGLYTCRLQHNAAIRSVRLVKP